jgi:hypothetical protein
MQPPLTESSALAVAMVSENGLKDIQEMLGQSSITVTADTYTSLLPEAELAIAEAAAGSYRAPAPPPRTPPPRRSRAGRRGEARPGALAG